MPGTYTVVHMSPQGSKAHSFHTGSTAFVYCERYLFSTEADEIGISICYLFFLWWVTLDDLYCLNLLERKLFRKYFEMCLRIFIFMFKPIKVDFYKKYAFSQELHKVMMVASTV